MWMTLGIHFLPEGMGTKTCLTSRFKADFRPPSLKQRFDAIKIINRVFLSYSKVICASTLHPKSKILISFYLYSCQGHFSFIPHSIWKCLCRESVFLIWFHTIKPLTFHSALTHPPPPKSLLLKIYMVLPPPPQQDEPFILHILGCPAPTSIYMNVYIHIHAHTNRQA